MTEESSTLAAPTMLVATPQVMDPFFDHSVVLLLHHDENGSFGLNINRPTELEVEEILAGLEIRWGGAPGGHAFFGGPVQPQLGSVLFDTSSARDLGDSALLSAAEICPGVRMTQNVDHLTTLADKPPECFRLYLGYAGWAAGQLVGEIIRNDWIIVPVIDRLLFSVEPQDVWALALEAAGVDPESLPSWTPDQSDSQAN